MKAITSSCRSGSCTIRSEGSWPAMPTPALTSHSHQTDSQVNICCSTLRLCRLGMLDQMKLISFCPTCWNKRVNTRKFWSSFTKGFCLIWLCNFCHLVAQQQQVITATARLLTFKCRYTCTQRALLHGHHDNLTFFKRNLNFPTLQPDLESIASEPIAKA